MSPLRIVIFGNISQLPFINNLLPPVLAFRRVGDVRVVEPYLYPDFTPGGPTPASVSPSAVGAALTGFIPDLVICLAGSLYVPAELRAQFPRHTLFVHYALSDMYWPEASLKIGPEFDLFYTQETQTLNFYAAHGIQARRCDMATDPGLYRPLELEPEYDILFYGRWTPYRDPLIRALANRFNIRVHTHLGEARWNVPIYPPLQTPQSLCEALNRAKLALEVAYIDDQGGPFKGQYRLTNRVSFASACAVPCLVEDFDTLAEYFEPGREIETYHSLDDLLARAEALLRDDARRTHMGRLARERVLHEQTWDLRIQACLADAARLRPGSVALYETQRPMSLLSEAVGVLDDEPYVSRQVRIALERALNRVQEALRWETERLNAELSREQTLRSEHEQLISLAQSQLRDHKETLAARERQIESLQAELRGAHDELRAVYGTKFGRLMSVYWRMRYRFKLFLHRYFGR